MSLLKLGVILIQLAALCQAVEYLHLSGDARTIRGYTSQTLPIEVPFTRSFKATTMSDEHMEHITFQPNRLHMEEQGKLFLGGKNKNILESLRSAYADEYRQILVFDEYVLVLKGMNEVLVLEETAEGFKLKNHFEIQEINYGTLVFRAYPYHQKALLFSSNEIFLLSNKGYYTRLSYVSDDRGMVAHAEWIQGTDLVLVAEYAEGLAVYRIDEANNRTEHITTFDASFFNQSAISVQDMNLRHRSDKKLYVLDRHFGLLQVEFNYEDVKKSKFTGRLSDQQNCYALDTVDRNYFVLSCSYETENYLSEVILNENNTATVLKPLFKDEFIADVQMTADYYLSLSRKMVTVYWNSYRNHLPEQFRQGSSLVVPGTEIISLTKKNSSHMLYVIADNQLVRYRLKELPPKLQFRSDESLDLQYNISVYGSCAHLNKSVYASNQLVDSEPLPTTDKQFCVHTAQYKFSVSELHPADRSDVSVSISVVIILLVVLLMLIWICLKKYRKLESEARRMLDEFKNRHSKQRFGL